MTDAEQTLDQVVGAHVLRARSRMKKTQKEFGDLLGTVLDRPWPAQTVSIAEKGQRPFSVGELVAIAHLVGEPAGAFLTPDSSHVAISVTGALTLSPVQLVSATQRRSSNGAGNESPLSERSADTLDRIVRLTSELGGLGDQVERLGNEAWRAALELTGANDAPNLAPKPTQARTSADRPSRAIRSNAQRTRRG